MKKFFSDGTIVKLNVLFLIEISNFEFLPKFKDKFLQCLLLMMSYLLLAYFFLDVCSFISFWIRMIQEPIEWVSGYETLIVGMSLKIKSTGIFVNGVHISEYRYL
jgi:hypothetical protein